MRASARTTVVMMMMSLAAFPACSSGTADASLEESEGELRRLSAAEILGDLTYGETSKAVHYTARPTYRAFRFQAAAGDEVDIWVRSADGDARVWLLDDDFHNVDKNDDADATTTDAHLATTVDVAGTYYVAFREKNGNAADLTVSLDKTQAAVPAGPGPNLCVRSIRRERPRGCTYNPTASGCSVTEN